MHAHSALSPFSSVTIKASVLSMQARILDDSDLIDKFRFVGGGCCVDSKGEQYDYLGYLGGFTLEACQVNCITAMNDISSTLRGIESDENDCYCLFDNDAVHTIPAEASKRDATKSGTGGIETTYDCFPWGGSCYKYRGTSPTPSTNTTNAITLAPEPSATPPTSPMITLAPPTRKPLSTPDPTTPMPSTLDPTILPTVAPTHLPSTSPPTAMPTNKNTASEPAVTPCKNCRTPKPSSSQVRNRFFSLSKVPYFLQYLVFSSIAKLFCLDLFLILEY